jgi:GNAT superfamily N-acetyltransferase
VTTPTVLRAAPIDVNGITDTLQQAFFDDPIMGFLFPKESSRRWRTAKFFDTELRSHQLPLKSAWCTANHEAAALWAPPGHWQLPPATIARNFVPLARAFGRRLPRALRVLSHIEKEHPREPHWYLAILGTAPRYQGKGFGAAVMAPVLEICDTEGLPAYLESSKHDNIAFYGRLGFEVTREMQLPGGGPTVWPMWRVPR